MSRYMDVDELYKIFVNLCKDLDRVYEVDAVEVVRCRDCKYATYDKSIDSYDCFWSGDSDQYTEANDFCSYGERAEERA